LFVSALVRALSHQIRTPLSVISNELSYFKTLLPADECNRSLERCRGISEILSEISPKCLHDFSLNRIELAELLLVLKDYRVDLSALKGKSVVSNADQLRSALDLAEKALCVLGPISNKEIQIAPRQLEIMIAIRPASEVKDRIGNSAFQFLSELICRKLEADSSLAPLADLLFWGAGAKTEISCDSLLKLKVLLDIEAG